MREKLYPVKWGGVVDYSGVDATCTHLKCTVEFANSGVNMMTRKPVDRGYYAIVSPVTIENGEEQFSLFQGWKELLLPCDRKGKKNLEAAEKVFDERIDEIVHAFYPGLEM